MYKESKTIELNHKHYCAYCGQEAKCDTEWDDWDPIYHYYCKCEDSKNEMRLNEEILRIKIKCESEVYKVRQPYKIQIYELEKQIPKEKYSVQTKVLMIDEQNSKN